MCRDNKDEFEGFLGEEFDAYCTSMEKPGIWGDELTLVSAHFVQRPSRMDDVTSCHHTMVHLDGSTIYQQGISTPAHHIDCADASLHICCLLQRAACDVYGIIVNVLTSDQHNW